MSAKSWAQECQDVGLRIGVDERGLTHVVIDDTGWANCGTTCTVSDEVSDRVCMWCRELPGRERHARDVQHREDVVGLTRESDRPGARRKDGGRKMMHDHHPSLPGYSPEQILHDGCAECEARGARPYVAIANMDGTTFEHAWKRAGRLQLHGLSDGSQAEIDTLRIMALIQVKLESRGFSIGELPISWAPGSHVVCQNEVPGR